MEKVGFKIWNVTMKNGQQIKAGTLIEQPRKASPLCEGCHSKCCQGVVAPMLTEEEFLSRKLPFEYITTPEWLKEKAPRMDYLVVIAVSNGGCPYFNKEKRNCNLWPNPPKACLMYDCRTDPRPEMKNLMEERMGM